MKKTNRAEDPVWIYVIALLVFVLPWLLWIIERALPYPEILEELAKFGVVLLVIGRGEKKQWRDVWTIGVVFGLSESLLYLQNLNLFGSLEPLGSRLVLTVPMHVVSISLIYGFTKLGKMWMIVGLILAIFFHYQFNLLVG